MHLFWYLVPFEMVIGIICKNVFFSMLLAMFWFFCIVILVDSWREVWCLFLQLGMRQFTIEEQEFNICPSAKHFQHNFSFSTDCFFSNKGFDENWSQAPSLWSSEQNQHFISRDSSWLILFDLIWSLGRYGWSIDRIFAIGLNCSLKAHSQVWDNFWQLKAL